MYSYTLLETGCYYLVQEKETEAALTLLKVNLTTDQCVNISKYGDAETMEWKKKDAPIFDILELLDDDKVSQWKTFYFNEEMDYEEEEDDE
jgi:hypothetical protein